MKHSPTPLLVLLKKLRLLSDQLDPSIIELSSEGPIRFFASRGLFAEDLALAQVGKALGIPVYDLDDEETLKRMQTPAFVDRVNPDLCWEHKMVPLWEEDECVAVAIANPLDDDGTRALEFELGCRIQIGIAPELKIAKLLDEYLPPSKTEFDRLSDIGGGKAVEILQTAKLDLRAHETGADTLPLVSLANQIIGGAVKEGASDIHIEPLQYSVDVRYRIDGMMRSVVELPKRLQSALTSRLKLLSGMDIAERRRPQDGRLHVRVSSENLDLRVSAIPTAHGEKLVLRLLRSNSNELTFSALHLPRDVERALKSALRARGKLLMVTGPTGSGKTTTLYTCLNFLKDGTSNIETVEDPIEYQIPGIQQIQVNDAIDVTFASALRSILRQDPDVIMVGEIRDSETAMIALQAAETGHLVLSTLHTNDAAATIPRLLGLGVPAVALSTGLAGVLAQRLVRRICTQCKTQAKYDGNDEISALMRRYHLNSTDLQKGAGCKTCGYTGYKGRVGIFSYLEITPGIAKLIHDGESLEDIVVEGQRNGFRTLNDAAIELIRSGITSYDEVQDYLTLPSQTQPLEFEVKPIASARKEPVADTQAIRKQKVLIVDDEPHIRAMFSFILQRAMLEVVEASNGRDALEKVYAENPSIVLCDLRMPEMDGQEFLTRMRSDERTRNIPVVILTSNDSSATEVSLLDLGAREFLRKSSPAEVIVTRLRRAMAQ